MSLRKKNIRNILRIFPNMVLLKINFFWAWPFLINKVHINGEEIILKSDNETVIDSSVLAEMFNPHYINIAEKTSEKKPKSFCSWWYLSDTTQAIDLSVQLHLNHFSINLIKTTSKNQIPSITSFNFCGTNPEEIFKLLSISDTKKIVGFYMIPPKLVKMAASVLCQPSSNSVNNTLSKDIFPGDEKIVMVSPLDKKKYF